MRALTVKTIAISALLGAALATNGGAFAQEKSAAEKPGRFVMSPIDGGFARLDTETGLMSICKGTAANFKCELAPDTTTSAQKEAEKTTAEAKELRAEIKRLEEMLGLGDKPGAGNKQAEEQRPGTRPGGSMGGPGGSGFKLPTEAEVDDALNYIEKMVKKFKSRLKDLEMDGKGDRL
jgi:hypothetical protein